MNKFSKTLALSTLALASTSALADISANVAMTSDYMFRGISQTDHQIALQGGFDYEHESGFYVGTWASNIASTFFAPGGTDPQIEWDMYLGYAGSVGDISYDLSYLHYQYPGSGQPAGSLVSDANTDEFKIGVGYTLGPVDLSAELYYSPELRFILSDKSAWYLGVGAEMSPMENLNLHAGVGYSFGDAWEQLGGVGGPDSYMDYSIGAGYSVMGVDLDLSYIDVNSDGQTMFGGGKFTDGQVVFTVSKSF